MLFTQSEGTGRDLVLLHGWGMNGDVWESVVPMLAKNFRVTTVDLPGHGRSSLDTEFTLEAVTAQIADAVPHGALVLGWSLGGLIATQLALKSPERVAGLILLCSAPRFVRTPDWPGGVDAGVLAGFARDLQTDFQGTIKRFLAIQAMGSDRAREEMRGLRDRLFRHGEPNHAALAGGLEILRSVDLRARLSELKCPTWLIAGENDMLFPPAAARHTRELIADARLIIIKGAGHAPFISHPDVFLSALESIAANHG
jgi:pimeloyl-[acyl-carrier protein] methyl ester esterase